MSEIYRDLANLGWPFFLIAMGFSIVVALMVVQGPGNGR